MSAFVRATTRLIVPFYDCDPMSIVWHGNYLKYFEQARMALFHQCKLDVPEIAELGFVIYVADTRVRFTHPCSYGDEIEVSAKTAGVEPLLKIVYSVQNRTRGRRCVRGNTVLAITDRDGQLLRETPSVIVDRLRA